MLKKVNIKKRLDIAIERAIMEAEYYEPHSEEYREITDRVKVMTEARERLNSGKRLDPNTIANLVGTALLVVVTMNYEQVRCYTTKATMWLKKLW